MSYKTDAEIRDVVCAFETCQTGKDDFHHQQHLVVAAWYLQTLTIEAATEAMRDALLRFLDHHGVDTQKYNQTLTAFWLEMLALELRKLPAESAMFEKCNSVIGALNNPKLVSEFYSEELLWSEEARESFVDPDLRRWK